MILSKIAAKSLLFANTSTGAIIKKAPHPRRAFLVWRREGLSPRHLKQAQKLASSSTTASFLARYCTSSTKSRHSLFGDILGLFYSLVGNFWGCFLNANEPSPRPGIKPSSLIIRRRDNIPCPEIFFKSEIIRFHERSASASIVILNAFCLSSNARFLANTRAMSYLYCFSNNPVRSACSPVRAGLQAWLNLL